jgi:hypothetical protein
MKNNLIFTSMNQTKRVFAIILINCFIQISCQDANNKKVEPEKDRDSIYTPHPKHQEFVASLQPFVEKVFVVDYWAK